VDEKTKIEYINYFERYLENMVWKFHYYTTLDQEDLKQEGYLKILSTLRKLENNKMLENLSKVDINKFINRSIFNHFLNITRDNPSYAILETTLEPTNDSVLCYQDFSGHSVKDLMENEKLKEDDKKVAIMLLLGFTQEEIGKYLGIAQSTVAYKLKKIRKVWGEYDE
jgi:DNA-directed RNA polymerase specialized sigma24 family protein